MVNAIPIIGWIISLMAFVFISMPFWVIWTYYEIGRKFFPFLSDAWHTISYPECVGVFMCVYILRSVALPSLRVNIESGK